MTKIYALIKMVGRCRPCWLPLADRLGRLQTGRPYAIKYNGTHWQARAGVGDFRVLNEIFIHGSYDTALAGIVPGSTVIDIGANIGAFSIAVSRAGAGRVFAFEPVPANAAQLHANVMANSLESIIKIQMRAVSRQAGTVSLYERETDAGGGTLYPQIHESWHTGDILKTDVKKIEVESVPLGGFMDQEKVASCDLLKLDCEGAEFEIFDSLGRETADKIQAIVFEYHSDGNLAKILELLKGYGFCHFQQRHPYQVILATRG